MNGEQMLFDVAATIEQTASQAGLLTMKAMIDDEVKELSGEQVLPNVYERTKRHETFFGSLRPNRRRNRHRGGEAKWLILITTTYL